MDVPDVSYAQSGDVSIAYKVVGEGPKDLVLVPFLSNIYTLWQAPRFGEFAERLAADRRLLVVNPRGVGLSDRPRGFTVESRMDDISAVMDAAQSEQAVLLGIAEQAATCAFFAASYPERVEGLVLYNAWGRAAGQGRRPAAGAAGDGFFARFDGPARAIACARSIVERVPELGLTVRAGIHTGECERVGDKLAGLAVNVGARVSGAAWPGEVLVSQTVKDLVAGSGIEFDERGAHELKGVPGEWRLYAVTAA